MAWTAPKTWVASEDVDFGEFNTEIRDNLNETAPGIASAAGRLIVTDGENSIAERIPTKGFVTTSETTTSTSYTDLATAGPAVTVTTGTSALIIVSAQLRNETTNAFSRMSFAVSGATTDAANSNRSLATQVDAGDNWLSASYAILLTALTAGSNTFTAKYVVSAGTGTFQHRRILVIPF